MATLYGVERKAEFQICDIIVYFNHAYSLISKKRVRDSSREEQKHLKSKNGHFLTFCFSNLLLPQRSTQGIFDFQPAVMMKAM